MKTKKCSKCGEAKPAQAFGKNRSKKDGLQTYCKSCRNLVDAKYLQSEKGKATQKRAQAKYAQTENGKAAKSRASAKFNTKIPPAVYKITCCKNDRCYIGSSKIPNQRRSDHWSKLKGGYHYNPSLQADYNRYGESAFTFEIVEHCKEQELRTLEQHYIDKGGNLYNIQDAAR